MRSSFKIALLAIFLIGLVGLFIGLYLFNREAADLGRGKADFIMTPADLRKAFSDNEALANSTYLNKVIEVTGTIESVTAGQNDALNVSLSTGDPLSAVICTFRSVSDPSAFTIGEDVTIRGECSGALMDILLNNCVVIKK